MSTFPTVSYNTTYSSATFPSLSVNDLPEADEKTQKYALNKIQLDANEKLLVEPSAMLAYENLSLSTKIVTQKVSEAMKRYFLGDEQLCINEFTAQKGGGWIAFEEASPRQIMAIKLKPNDPPLKISRQGFLACTPNINLKIKFAGVSGLMRGMGLGRMTTELTNDKEGTVYINSNECEIKVIEVREGQTIHLDNNYILAYSGNLKSTFMKISKLTHFCFSGEGLVAKVTGNGKIYVGSGKQNGTGNLISNTIRTIWKDHHIDIITGVMLGSIILTVKMMVYLFPKLVVFLPNISKEEDDDQTFPLVTPEQNEEIWRLIGNRQDLSEEEIEGIIQSVLTRLVI